MELSLNETEVELVRSALENERDRVAGLKGSIGNRMVVGGITSILDRMPGDEPENTRAPGPVRETS